MAVAGEESAAKPKQLFLIVDYLPAAVYLGDEIAINVRVENTSKAALQGVLSLDGMKRGGEAFALKPQAIACAAAGFASASFSVSSADATSFGLKLTVAGESTASFSVDVLHDDEAWPKTTVRNGVIEKEAAAGERVVWVPARREKKVDRAFLPMKWLLGSDEKKDAQDAEKKAAGNILSFLPAGYSEGKAGVESLGPYGLDGNAPVLHAARAILDRLGTASALGGPTGLVIGLPPEDIEAATDPRLFRVVLDGLLTRVRTGGIQRVAVLPPFKYGISDERMKGFWKETADACAAHQTQYVDPALFLNETHWRVDPVRAGAYAAKPNAAGREQLGAYLKDLGVATGGK